jgi:hypothetical protein
MKTEVKTQLTDEIKKLIQLNISTEDFRGVPGEFGKNEAGNWTILINWDNLPQRYIDICNKNINIITELTEIRNKRTDILVGDYLEMPDESMSRVTYCHENGVQDGGGAGSFFLYSSGNGSYSGGLDGIKPFNKIKPTNRTKKALFWIFSKNWAGANRGFYFYIDVKVWKIEEMFKTVYVKFNEWKYNYHTNINGKLSNEEIKKYFVNQSFNLGDASGDNMQRCIDCAIYY